MVCPVDSHMLIWQGSQAAQLIDKTQRQHTQMRQVKPFYR